METIKQIISTVNPHQLLDDATAALKNESYYDAMHLLNTFLLFDPSHKDARLKKGLTYLYTEQYKKALSIFKSVLEEGPYAGAFFCFAEYHKLMFEFDHALSYIKQALELDEENVSYHLLSAEICYLQRDDEDAFVFINRAIVLNPFREELYYWRALLFIRFEKYNIAINDLNRAISVNPQYAEAYRLRASVRMRKGEVDQALTDLKDAQKFELLASSRVAFAA